MTVGPVVGSDAVLMESLLRVQRVESLQRVAREIGRADEAMQKNIASIASGEKSVANSPADVSRAARLEASERESAQRATNAAMESDMSRVREGQLAGASEALQRVRESAVRAGNGVLTAGDREIIQQQVDQDLAFVRDLMGDASPHFEGFNVATPEAARETIGRADRALESLVSAGAEEGVRQNRLQSQQDVLAAQEANMAEARSRIEAADIAEEMIEFSMNRLRRDAAMGLLSAMQG